MRLGFSGLGLACACWAAGCCSISSAPLVASDAGSDLDDRAAPDGTEPGEVPMDVGAEPDAPNPTDAMEVEVPATGPVSCADAPPAGAALPPPPPAYSGTACPALAAGANSIVSTAAGTANTRALLLAVPMALDPLESLPVVFLWHWLGASAADFYTEGDVQNAVDTMRFLAIMPEAKGDLTFRWPYATGTPAARMQEEFVFFDDMLACVSQQFNTNPSCVSSVGVSAGALFTDQLAGGRGEYLASFLSLSGGTGGSFIEPWTSSPHKMPAMVLWGGPTDICVILNFETVSRDLETNLIADGHFFLECVHNCGHGAPPFDVPPGTTAFWPMWRFILDHPYWLPDGASPYVGGGIPAGLPSWCGIGMSSAVPRTGACLPPSC